MNNPSQTKDVNLQQLLEDWIGDNVLVSDNIWADPRPEKVRAQNALRAELRTQIPALLAKIEQHVLEARKDELEWVLRQDGNVFVGNGENQIQWNARNRIAELDALLNTKGKNNVSLTSNSDTPGSSSIVDDTPQQEKS